MLFPLIVNSQFVWLTFNGVGGAANEMLPIVPVVLLMGVLVLTLGVDADAAMRNVDDCTVSVRR